MARAILSQVAHDPHKFTPEMLMRQAAMFMLKNPYKYYKPLEIELLRTGESYVQERVTKVTASMFTIETYGAMI